MFRFKASVEYYGPGFHGMQKQAKMVTVQGVLEEALGRLFGESIEINFAGRTDAGVHALGQVIDFASAKPRTEEQILYGVNYFLSRSRVRLVAVERVDIGFDSRLDAKMRHYVYKIINRSAELAIHPDTHCLVRGKVDFDALVNAGQMLLGTHDFSSFRHPRCHKNPVKTLSSFKAERIVQPFGIEIHLYFSARSFLYNMVRKMVGSIVGVGTGRYSPGDISLLLGGATSSVRLPGVPTFPPHGLYLLKIDY